MRSVVCAVRRFVFNFYGWLVVVNICKYIVGCCGLSLWPVTRRGPLWPVMNHIACFGSSAVLLRSLVSSMVVTLLLALCTLLDVPLTAESQRREYIRRRFDHEIRACRSIIL